MTAPTATSLAALDAAHRAQQAQNAQEVSQLIAAYFLTRVNAEDLAGTSGPWLDFSIGRINRAYERSYMLAAAYTRAVQRTYIPGATPIEIPRPPAQPVEKLRRSLSYTGPGTAAVELRKTPDTIEPPRDAPPEEVERYERAKTSRGERIKIVMEKAAAAAAGSAYKNVLNGGRDTVDQLVVTKRVVGYQRITKDNPCGFCLMLASRGPVYQGDSFDRSDPRFTGPGEHKVHDSCGCSLRPLFSRDPANWTDQARQADELWRRMLKENPTVGGNDAVNRFRAMAREAGLADLNRW